MVSIDGNLYEKGDIESLVDETYYTAVYMASLLTDAIDALPVAEQITILDGDKVAEAVNYYNSMDSYGLSFMSEDYLNKYTSSVEQYYTLMKAREAADNNSEDASSTDEESKDTQEV